MLEITVSNANKRIAADDLNNDDDLNNNKKLKLEESLKKRKMCAILLIYSGQGYFGMQRNVGFKTIEGELFEALLAAELIDRDSFETPSKVKFQRASKTDRDVSACGQVCSLKIPDDCNATEKLNRHLPADIRVLDVFRTTKTFHAKSHCKNRSYRYITPSFAFSPRETPSELLSSYRITSDTLKLINGTLSQFKGTHNFHNFTSGKPSSDKSCQRYITNLTCQQPFLNSDSGLEYVTIVIEGQSFMMHQIRKMVALTMAVCRGFCDSAASVFQMVFSEHKVDLPRAPGLGLLLDHVNYEHYNKRQSNNSNNKNNKKNKNTDDDNEHQQKQTIDWNRYTEDIAKFREKYIHSHILKIESEEKPMLTWLDTLARHSYTYRVDDCDSERLPQDTPEEEEEECAAASVL